MGLFGYNKDTKIKKVKQYINPATPISICMANIQQTNSYLDIVEMACKECYNGKLTDDINKKLNYIASKVKLGHESVLEHSNIVIRLIFSDDMFSQVAEVLSHCEYLVTEMAKSKNLNVLGIAGSVRGYKEMIKNIENPLMNNVIKEIISALYGTYKEFYIDLIADGIMEESKFDDPELLEIPLCRRYINKNEQLSKISIVNSDDVVELQKSFPEFKPHQIFRMVSITVHMEAVARVITQMITRHRNAISQMSQRYVDEHGASWVNPMDFKKQFYCNKLKEANPELDDKSMEDAFEVNRQKVDDILAQECKFYEELRDEIGLLKEDARYVLPNAVESSLYVTFHGKTLLKFINLRDDSAAQIEVQNIGKDLHSFVNDVYGDFLGTDIFKFLEPVYKIYKNENDFIEEIDEDINEQN